jgi:hypothetical protein
VVEVKVTGLLVDLPHRAVGPQPGIRLALPGSAAPADAFLAPDAGAFASLSGQEVRVSRVLIAPAQIAVRLPCLDGVVRAIRVLARVNCRSGPKCASIGFTQDAFVRVKHRSTLFRAAQRTMRQFLWADRLSMIT